MRTIVLAAALAGLAAPAAAQPAPGFAETDGAALYRAACQACHMPDGKGAVGAGAYPALSGNPRLIAAPYAIALVLHGRAAMPGMGRFLSDAQVAAVVQFIRTDLGNGISGPVRPAEVASQR
jgi:mono/diheme cytochrome c family protein